MKQIGLLLGVLLLFSCSNNTKEKDKSVGEAAYDQSDVPQLVFKTIGETQPDNTKWVTKIEVFEGQNQLQTLEGFKAEVAKNEEVTVEDINFDGYPDLRLMQYLPTDESIAYFYWLYDAEQRTFVRNTQLEEKVFSPSIDSKNQWIVSQWRKNDGTFGSDAFSFTSAANIQIIQSEKNIPYQDSMYRQVIVAYSNGQLQDTKENIYKPNVRIPLPL